VRDSIRIGSVFGITIRVHVLFLVMLAFFLFSGQQSSALLILLLFGLVFLHELGHSLVAQSMGIRVLDITFWPLGGMARMSEIPEDTRTEALIAVAGPAVNFLLAGLAAPLFLFTSVASMDTAPAGQAAAFPTFLWMFIWINLALGLFNLVPAFPMDGGRILRAFLGRKGDWVEATTRAVRIGRFFALAMIIGGLMIGHCMLPIVGIWLWWVGGQELRAVRLRHGLFPFGDFFRRPGAEPGASGAAQDPGAPRRGNPFFQAQGSGSPRVRWRPRGQAPDRAAHPDQIPPDAASGPTGGYSEEELRRMENFRGRLGRPPSAPDN
jgi:Zn-dependent protease